MSTEADAHYTITRDEAADKLGVSIRTLDRWLRAGKLDHRLINRVVLIHEEQLAHVLKQAAKIAGTKAAHAEAAAEIDDRDTLPFADAEALYFPGNNGNNDVELLYKKLYEDTAAALKQKQEKLEAASYRVGQLEATLQNSVPLLEHKQTSETLQKVNREIAGMLATERLKSWVFLACFLAAGVLVVVLGWLLVG